VDKMLEDTDDLNEQRSKPEKSNKFIFIELKTIILHYSYLTVYDNSKGQKEH
jgi:hypothetical protein